MNFKDKDVLGLQFPQKPEEDEDYLLNMREILESKEFLQKLQQQDPDGSMEKLKEAKAQVLKAINAASGLRKVIEQLHSENATVRLGTQDKEVKRAVKRIFKKDSDEITFEMYKTALERVREIGTVFKEKIVDDQRNPE